MIIDSISSWKSQDGKEKKILVWYKEKRKLRFQFFETIEKASQFLSGARK